MNRRHSARLLRRRNFSDLNSAGFTLLELLAATAITLALTGMALAIVVHSLGLWHRVQAGFAQANQSGPVLEQIERDIQGALHPDGTAHWLSVELQNSAANLRDAHGWIIGVPVHGRIKPDSAISLAAGPVAGADGSVSDITHARFALGGVWLRFFSTDGSGLPLAVSYQLVRRPIGSATARAHYLLLRTTTTDVLSRGHDITAGYDDVLAAPPITDALADGVVDFGVWLYVRDESAPDGLRIIFPVDSTDAESYRSGNTSPGSAPAAYPLVADVMVRILSDEGAALLANLEAGVGRSETASDSDWWKLVAAHSSVFVSRIEIKGAGL